MRPPSTSIRRTTTTLSRRSLNDSSVTISGTVYSLVDEQRWGEAVNEVRLLLSKAITKRSHDQLGAVLFACEYRAGNLDECTRILGTVFNSITPGDVKMRIQLLILTNKLDEAVRLCQSQMGPSRSSLFSAAIRELHVLARVGLGDTHEARAVLDLSGVSHPTHAHLQAMILFTEFAHGAAFKEDPQASQYNKALYAHYLGRSAECRIEKNHPESAFCANLNIVQGYDSDISGSDPFISFNKRLLLSQISDEEKLEMLEGIVNTSASTFYQDALVQFAIANLLIKYVEAEEFVKASDLFANSDISRIKRCFVDPKAFLVLRFSIHCHAPLTRPQAVLDLEALVADQLRETKTASPSLLGLVCVLGKALYDNGEFEHFDALSVRTHGRFRDSPEWIINTGNVLFVQGKFAEAAVTYKRLIDMVLDADKRLIDLPAAVLASYCVALILTDAIAQAEDILTLVHHEEESSDACTHSTVINIVIGHLYCGRENFEFGLDRVMEALGDMSRINAETWLYAKKAFMALFAATVSGQYPILPDKSVTKLVAFLEMIVTANADDRDIQKEAGTVLKLTRKILT